MTKTLTSINFDTDVLEWARVNIENVSAECNDHLKTLMDKAAVPVVRVEDIPAIIEEYDDISKKLDGIKGVIAQNEMLIAEGRARLKLTRQSAQFEGVTELDDVRPDQCASNEFMLGMVTVLRSKYPSLSRIDVRTLREYLETREATA
jgi:hypothetical protein